MGGIQITTREIGGVRVVDVKGNLTLGNGTAGLRNTVRAVANGGDKKVIINLRNTNTIDGAGLGELMSALTTLNNWGADVRLIQSRSRSKVGLPERNKIETVFTVCENEAAAVRSFS